MVNGAPTEDRAALLAREPWRALVEPREVHPLYATANTEYGKKTGGGPSQWHGLNGAFTTGLALTREPAPSAAPFKTSVDKPRVHKDAV
jgi:hypothetical protein